MNAVATLAPSTGDAESRRRFNVAAQTTRLVIYGLAGAFAVVSRATGHLPADVPAAVSVVAVGMGTTFALRALFARGIEVIAGISLHVAAPLLDTALITWAVALTGGLASPWFLWYLSNTAGAAFYGRREAL